MDTSNKASRIDLFTLHTPQMRAFHVTWLAFFLCFFAWFGIAPLMSVVRDELGLTKAQIGNTIIASVAITVLARLLVGWLCDRIGPRLTYSGLLLVSAVPTIGIAFAWNYESLLIARLGIGIIGASFVITQYHTSVMFAPNCVGTANATTAGWGNLGGAVTQLAMPLMFGGCVALGLSESVSWRTCMALAGVCCIFMAAIYYFFTQDTPNGNFRELRAKGLLKPASVNNGAFWEACRDRRVWTLFIIYGGCFGIELTIDNIAALYFIDYFGASMATAGAVAACFGVMNIFARTLGGWIGDRCGIRWGMRGRVRWLALALACEGVALMLFSQMTVLLFALPFMLTFGLFMKMSEGATYSVVPFINRRALGPVSGIVGAGGNFGAVFAGSLFKMENLSWPTALFILGTIVFACAALTWFVGLGTGGEEAEPDTTSLENATLNPEPATTG